jgi:hypothetical protein
VRDYLAHLGEGELRVRAGDVPPGQSAPLVRHPQRLPFAARQGLEGARFEERGARLIK